MTFTVRIDQPDASELEADRARQDALARHGLPGTGTVVALAPADAAGRVGIELEVELETGSRFRAKLRQALPTFALSRLERGATVTVRAEPHSRATLLVA